MNPEYLLGSVPINVTIKQQRLFFLCRIRLSEAARNTIPLQDASKIHGDFLLGFSYPPQKGDIFEYEDRLIQIVQEPMQYPSRYKSREKKRPPMLICLVL
jgi:hypothetical protein